MKRAERDRPQCSPTVVPLRRWEEDSDWDSSAPPRSALLLAWAALIVWTLLGAVAVLWALS